MNSKAATNDLENEGKSGKVQEKGETIEHSVDQENAQVQDAEFSLDYTSGLLSQTDDPSTPALTIRSVLLGIIWGFLLSALNIVGSFRDIPLAIPTSLVSIVCYPMGIFLANVLPKKNLIPGYDWSNLNPGPFSVKEHVLVYIIASSAGSKPYGINNVIGQKLLFADKRVNLLNSILWVTITQLLGFGITGLFRRFLVRPTAMLWPAALSQVAFFNAFHETKELDEINQSYGTVSRFKAFWIAFAGMFIWTWFPAFFAQGLSFVALLCLIPNASRNVRFLGSGSNKVGPGILSLTFDWTQITAGSSTVYNPWPTTLNFLFGGILFAWIIGPIWFYTHAFGLPTLESGFAWGSYNISGISLMIPPALYNTSDVAKDPIPVYNSNSLYDSHGYILKVAQGPYPKLLDSQNNLNMTNYERAGKRIYLAPAMTLTYFASFISLGAVFSQVFLWYGKDLYKQFKDALSQKESDLYEKDVHARLLRAYGDVKDWAYLLYFIIMIIFAILICEFTPFAMEWWLTLICIMIGFLFTLPVGIIQAITGYQPGLNILTQVISGFLVPGHTTSVMAFKTMGYDISIQALNLSLDLKLGQYMHISPVSLVAAQLVGTVLGSLTMTTFAFIVMNAQPSDSQWISPWGFNGYRTFGNAGGIWGAIGPARFFGPDSPYYLLNVGYIIGFLGPFIPFFLNKLFPNPNWRKINIVLISAAYITMASGNSQIYITMPVIVGWFFQYYLFHYHRLFWNKYAWIITTGFDSAAPFTIFLSKILAMNNIEAPVWALNPINVPPDYYCFETTVE